MRRDEVTRSNRHDLTTPVVAVALAAAAGLHLAAFPQHVEEGAGVATFFLLTAALQLGAAVVVPRGIGRRGRALIAAGSAGLVLLWAVSRSVGVPGSGHGGAPEPVGLLVLLAVAAEITVVAGLLARRASPARLTVGAAWPASALIAFGICAAALRWVPPGHAHHDSGSPSAPAEIHAPASPVEPVASRSTAPGNDRTTHTGGCSAGSPCHRPHGHGDHAHPHR